MATYETFDARKTYRVGDRAIFHGILRQAKLNTDPKSRERLIWWRVYPGPKTTAQKQPQRQPERSTGYHTRDLLPGR